MTREECCSILGVEPNYSEKDLKKAYRAKCFSTHPDRNNGDDKEFKRIQEAYNTLTGKNKTRSSPPENSGVDISDLPINEILKNMGFGRGGFRYHPNMGFKRPERPPERDSEVSVEFRLTIEQIKKGGILKVNYNKSKTCTKCQGKGAKEANTCSKCRGSGIVQEIVQERGYMFSSAAPCDLCKGDGRMLKDPCDTCGANGFVVSSEHVDVEIKEKK